MKKASKFWFSMLIACFACNTSLVYANVVMTGTRVIYPAEQKKKRCNLVTVKIRVILFKSG